MRTIYTENKNLDTVKKWAGLYFDNYNIQKTIGVWKGQEENGVKISGSEKKPGAAGNLAASIIAHNDQDCALVAGEGDDRILYKVYAEHEKVKAVRRVISRYFDAYTFINEPGQVVFEIVADGYAREFGRELISKTGIPAFAHVIKAHLV